MQNDNNLCVTPAYLPLMTLSRELIARSKIIRTDLLQAFTFLQPTTVIMKITT